MPDIVLKEEVRNNKPWCLLVAEVIDSKLTVTRVDFEEWGRNSRSGQVEISHIYMMKRIPVGLWKVLTKQIRTNS